MGLIAVLSCGLSGCSAPQGSGLRLGQIGAAQEVAADVTRADIQAARVRLNPARVPAELRAVLPFAERWGIGDDAIREGALDAATDEEKSEFAAAVNPYNARITKWLDSFPQGSDMSDEAAAFMFMQSALDELGVYEEAVDQG
jgi:hypothetical protein